MSSTKGRFKELSRAKISDTRNVVISIYDDTTFTIAQQIDVEEHNSTTQVYLKGALQVQSKEHLVHLRDALDNAITIYELDYEEVLRRKTNE